MSRKGVAARRQKAAIETRRRQALDDWPPDRIAREMGRLHTAEDARRRLDVVAILAVLGITPGVSAGHAVRSVEGFLKLLEIENSIAVVEELRTTLKTCTAERDRALREVEQLRIQLERQGGKASR